ncbi:MAG: isoaspartyl peptidase/L-asparaginase [Sphingomonadales bacterium]|nr:isoaspartyl peptidase/L-asparaginase [Sphingomonadales bacterium]MBD3772033.1 isoaspartyl peptidase/L-asparaginase [Paracoccaceae bacterium]
MIKLAFALVGLAAITSPALAQDRPAPARWSIAIHGGAGTMDRAAMSEAQQADYKASLQAALDAGARVLASGGSAGDAVVAVITRLEDDPKFNAGRGAVFTWQGTNELDSSFMLGDGRRAGAVAGVSHVKNPILLARAVMEDGRHVMLSGTGAEEFAASHGIEMVDPGYFATPERRESLERLKADQLSAYDVDHKFGTVGAVALDTQGHVAAGTSTGGITGKRWGRIGDSPVIGAGTYAQDGVCAISATGSGEYFIRVGVAKSICDRIALAGAGAQDAADQVMAEVGALGGDGGVIVVAPNGDAVFSFNTQGMYRGRATSDGVNEVAIFAGE